jgi:hypothetical protein
MLTFKKSDVRLYFNEDPCAGRIYVQLGIRWHASIVYEEDDNLVVWLTRLDKGI